MDDIVCELRILNETDAEYQDDRYDGDLLRRGKIEKDPLINQTVERFSQWIHKADACSRLDLQTLGWHLYNIAFRTKADAGMDDIRKAFQEAYERFEKKRQNNPNARLRLRLTFSKDADKLAQHPWEFLYMPWKDKGFFLAGEKTDLILTRFVPEAGQVAAVTAKEDEMRILVIVSQPTRPKGKWGTVGADIVTKIKELETRKNAKINVQELSDRASPSAVRKKVDEFRPQIVHFIGHGLSNNLVLIKEPRFVEIEEAHNVKREAEGKPPLEITDANPVDGVTLCDLLIPSDPPQDPPLLVFLHACYGAASDSISSLRSVARELVAAHVPCVIAMQYEISNDDATLFATTFYEKVGSGYPIDEAVTKARIALATTARSQRNSWDDPSFGIPLIYLQSDQSVLFPRLDLPLPPSPPARVPCPYPDKDGCKGVKPDGKICITCKRKLMQCPQCNHIMPAEPPYKTCEECGWPEIISSTAKAVGSETGKGWE